ncbi:MAG: glycosyltransferase family 4 protein [Lachnospira eligens]
MKSLKKKQAILFVMPRLPFPALSGRKTSLYHYCRILSEELGYRLVVAAFLEGGDDPNLKPDFIDRLEILPKATSKEKLKNITMNSLIGKKKPMQVSLFWSKSAKDAVDKLVQEEKPDIVIGDMVRSTDYIKDIDAFRIADLDDRISLRYQRQLDNDLNGINPYGAFLNTVPSILQRIMLFHPIKKYVVKTEIELLKKYELEMGRECEKTVFVASQEAKDFNIELGEKKAFAIPIGVDTDTFAYRKTGNDGQVIGFLGAMSVAHNENAVRHFISDIFPDILKSEPTVKFLVIGGGVSENLQNLASENIIFTGQVPDVKEYLEKCKVFVCPMTFGSGIKTKNLEAMSLGLPVVTTSIGAENIDAVDGRDWLICNEDNKFTKAVVELLTNEEERVRIGINASRFIEKNFTWNVAKNAFAEVLECE